MMFEISRLNKIQLLQTLYLHGSPRGKGHIAFRTAKEAGKAVDGWLPDEECEAILQGKHQASGYMVDYYNGKPLKQDWRTGPNGQITIDTLPYDAAHGRYRFLEAVLGMFEAEDIVIIEKEYDRRERVYLTPEKVGERPIETGLKLILGEALLHINDLGPYWSIDRESHSYRSLYRNA